MFEVMTESHFSAAHHLLNYEGECEHQHGHNWKVQVFARGENLDKAGILIDFKVLKKVVAEVLELLDHQDLNELEYFKGTSPSSETIAKFIYKKLKEKFYTITKVSVWETERACATYFED